MTRSLVAPDPDDPAGRRARQMLDAVVVSRHGPDAGLQPFPARLESFPWDEIAANTGTGVDIEMRIIIILC